MSGSDCDQIWATLHSVPSRDDGLDEDDKRIAGYEILEPLGRGEFAEVFCCRSLVRDPGEPRTYALKRISKARLNQHSDVRRRIRSIKRVDSEIDAMRRLSGSPHVCALFEAYHTAQYIYLVLERCGGDLYEALSARPRAFTHSAVRGVALEVARALQHCWAAGVVHRDVKPENILIGGCADGGDDACAGRVKLCDFGLCAFRGADDSWRMGDFVGSPGFFAPEILLQASYDAERVDVWSLGCVVLELLEGHSGFEARWLDRVYNEDSLGNVETFKAGVDAAIGDLWRRVDRGSFRCSSNSFRCPGDPPATLGDGAAASGAARRGAAARAAAFIRGVVERALVANPRLRALPSELVHLLATLPTEADALEAGAVPAAPAGSPPPLVVTPVVLPRARRGSGGISVGAPHRRVPFALTPTIMGRKKQQVAPFKLFPNVADAAVVDGASARQPRSPTGIDEQASADELWPPLKLPEDARPLLPRRSQSEKQAPPAPAPTILRRASCRVGYVAEAPAPVVRPGMERRNSRKLAAPLTAPSTSSLTALGAPTAALKHLAQRTRF
ncbi:kinase-like domain-containing protein [Pelagophyceae sp. CCMP2097]|nr:kinase-like domain-containing protein [Pelagophyceae sp. CCMP2097]